MKDEQAGLTADMLLTAYATGIFPMAETRADPEIFWVDPRFRGVFPLDGFHVSRSLARRMRRGGYRVSIDTAFPAVVQACADREETWINDTIYELYEALFESGHAHSLEVWSDDGALVGGVYGVALGAAFFGESMFSRATDGSKIALAYLIDRLRSGGFTLFDTQFLTPHLASLGAIEIPRAEYRTRLARALGRPADFDAASPLPPAQEVIQRSTQTS
ncbi:possible leucyl/phenylalanyl-tRNA--protein transferase [Oceanicola granulosus HTCC2516]|uniref:Leucyl/phenylalanyl-tRNA--protein transferase n=1 Tax=Oceanicola granulosus (strain ATCC BAA-861 / DSM 15982 / KCTC 12143 / HTCC2516) TaxID=314256 RepID=Q2CFT0_OCEGH|nr:leucyl/phenylalanyl-tRNA--protein transferase [Oceanicola granulosus]EAR51612.1 possible leucyl/phenylalanyl-tRNA--protein transferase [Oceanicola granulosus HTCC2516]